MANAADMLARAECALQERNLARALALFHLAEAEGYAPDRCAGGRWMTAMLSGDFAAAWHESDAIRLRRRPDPHRFWQGEDFSCRRVIVRCLHGFGDIVQFLRYAPLLHAHALNIVAECAPRAVDLVRCLPGIDEVATWDSEARAGSPVWDVQVELMELPYIFRSTLADLPAVTPYLDLSQAELEHASRLLSRGREPNIGVVWSAGDWNPSRSIPLSLLASVLARPGWTFVNLQGGPVREQWADLSDVANLRDVPELTDAGLVPLAAAIAQLDLIITVDTLAAHLAGALNIPCLLLLQYAADWRWMIDRDDSPWYPSLRLVRQPKPNDWQGAVLNLNRILDQWFANRMRVAA